VVGDDADAELTDGASDVAAVADPAERGRASSADAPARNRFALL
jgi:hypothetical protein